MSLLKYLCCQESSVSLLGLTNRKIQDLKGPSHNSNVIFKSKAQISMSGVAYKMSPTQIVTVCCQEPPIMCILTRLGPQKNPRHKGPLTQLHCSLKSETQISKSEGPKQMSPGSNIYVVKSHLYLY
jgi:hypothetical protein